MMHCVIDAGSAAGAVAGAVAGAGWCLATSPHSQMILGIDVFHFQFAPHLFIFMKVPY